MTALEDRLRADLRAESELISPGSVRPLSLAEEGRRPSPRYRGPRHWSAWMTPVAAAAAVAAVIAGTIAVSHLVIGGPPARPGPVGWASYSHLPPYYATTVEGNVVSYVWKGSQYSSSVLGRHIKIHATGTGKTVTTVNPPRPYNDFVALSGSEDGRTFVFAAERYFGFRGHRSPHTGALDPSAPVRFVVLHIDSGGHPRLSAPTLPFTVLPNQQPSIALSPDGTRLAVAYGGGGQDALARVVSLATGKLVRQWGWPGVSWTPLLQAQGAWAADGRTLLLQQWYVTRGANGKTPQRTTPADTTPVWLLDTAAPADGSRTDGSRTGGGRTGGSRTGGAPLLLRAPAGMSAPWAPFLTPDGRQIFAVVTRRQGGGLRGPSQGEYVVYSTQTGALTRTLARWSWPARRNLPGLPSPLVAWSDRTGRQVLVIQPQRGVNRLGVLTGGTVTLTGSRLLPSQPAGYSALQSALQQAGGVPPSMTW